jgi:hypothetical protein
MVSCPSSFILKANFFQIIFKSSREKIERGLLIVWIDCISLSTSSSLIPLMEMRVEFIFPDGFVSVRTAFLKGGGV